MLDGRRCAHCGNLYPHSYWLEAPRSRVCCYCFAASHLSQVESLYVMWLRFARNAQWMATRRKASPPSDSTV